MHRLFLLSFTLCLLLTSCNKSRNTTVLSPDPQKLLLSNSDMSGAVEFICTSASVINRGETFTKPNPSVPNLLVQLLKEKKVVSVQLGKDLIILRNTHSESNICIAHKGENIELKAFCTTDFSAVDSICIFGKEGQGKTILKFIPKP